MREVSARDPESASPWDVPCAEVFPQDLFLVLSNQDQLAPFACRSVSPFHLGLAAGFSGFSFLGRGPEDRRSFPAAARPSLSYGCASWCCGLLQRF